MLDNQCTCACNPIYLSSLPIFHSSLSLSLSLSLSSATSRYVKGLKLIDRDFRSTILSANRAHDKPILSEDTLKLILGNVSSILTLNAGMLAELEERMKMWSVEFGIRTP